MDVILVLNAGSSSLKFQVFDIAVDGLARRVKGQIDGIGVRPHFHASDRNGTIFIDEHYTVDEIEDLPAATQVLKLWLRRLEGVSLRAVGHRVVHGGPDYTAPVRIDGDVLAKLETYQSLAPLHQPNNLAPIRLVMDMSPGMPQVACFDTAFHRGHPAVADHYALPRAFYDQSVRRYGFHGLSYDYIAQQLALIAPKIAKGRVIVAHLGSGASMCALLGGKSMESSMGFTALDGLPMGTRPGQLDPGVVLHLIEQLGMTAAQVSDLLYKESGLKGLSGISNDMRDLLTSDDPSAALAIDYFVHRAVMQIGALAAAMGGLDALVFTAGIGENAPDVRARIVDKLGWLGARIDKPANDRGGLIVSAAGAAVQVMVVPTDEEQMIARQTLALLQAQVDW